MAGRERKRRQVRVAVSGPERKRSPTRPMPWPLAALMGGFFVAFAGWLLMAGAVAIGWLAAPDADFGAALRLGTQLWLLANGGSMQLGGLTVTVIPLGMTAVILLLATGVAGYVVQQASADGPLAVTKVPQIVAVFAGTYLACVAGAGLATGSQGARSLLGALVIIGGSSWVIAYRATARRFTSSWPVWALSIPRAIAAGCLVLVAGGGVVLCIALLLAKDRVIALHDGLGAGLAGDVLLIVLHVAYLPNFLLWCVSWVLGAGFSLGAETIISPSENHVGFLPSLPIFAAAPPAGPGTWLMLTWLLVGVTAGAVSAVIVVSSRPRARMDETALVGGLSGVLTGALAVAACAVANGSLGNQRLASVGARLDTLVVLAPTLLGIAGLVCGAVLGVLRPVPKLDPDTDDDPATEPTQKVFRGSGLSTRR